jgi:2-polyprenyl-3-methyl-5-hydroxy-6-metoxy-1,4-benzoquinol methylase
MKENKYDDPVFFAQYNRMNRSLTGLDGAGEWHVFKEMLPDLRGKDVLDLGCGLGWHCRYAIENGAESVTGIDISEKMLAKAKEINNLEGISYKRMALEDAEFSAGSFDVVLSSLALHYTPEYEVLVRNIYHWLRPRGLLVFSVEHPVFTAEGRQDWLYEGAEKSYWPVDRYFIEGERNAVFLGENVVKYHRTLTTYLGDLLKHGFSIHEIQEPKPDEKMLAEIPEMQDELRRPMMLLVSAVRSSR